MRRSLFAVAALPLLLAASFAAAQTSATDCDLMLRRLQSMNTSSDEYAALKLEWYKQCGQNTVSTNKCADAESNNVKVKSTCTAQISVSKDANGCDWFTCGRMTDACAAAREANAKVETTCARNNIYRKVDDSGCTWLRCETIAPVADCSAAQKNNKEVEATCEDQLIRGKDSSGCLWLKCSTGTTAPKNTCEEAKMNNARVEKTCSREKISWTKDDNGCPWAKCDATVTQEAVPTTVACRKTMKDRCVIISCDDGYLFNSCENKCSMPPTSNAGGCTVTKDDAGCMVKKCPNGESSRVCLPKPFGSDGSSSSASTQECTTKKDDKGCLLKVCNGEVKAKRCPRT